MNSNQDHFIVDKEEEVRNQKEALFASQKQVENARKDYLNSVINTAIAKEVLVRKKEKVYKVALLAMFAFISVVLGIINIWCMVAFIGIVALILILRKIYNKETSNDDYDYRRNFFMKYKNNIPVDTNLKWKESVHWY